MPPVGPDSDWTAEDFTVPWWDDQRYIVGFLTTNVRVIRIINTLTRHDSRIECAAEETMNEILDRYLSINSHAASYKWKRLGKVLDMDKNLD